MRALIFVLALAACTQPTQTPTEPAPEAQAQDTTSANLAQMPTWETARAAGVNFRGVGQEPGWIVDIYQQGRIVALLDYGETRLEFPLNAPNTQQEGASIYQSSADGRTLRITVRRLPCQDAMSGDPYPATVELAIDDRTLNGCGKSV